MASLSCASLSHPYLLTPTGFRASRTVPAGLSALLTAVVVGGVACGSPDLSGPAPAATFWAVTLNAHAVALDTMAPYDTLTLVATARDAQGQPLAGAPAVTFTSSDSSVRVSPTGVLTARRAVGPVQVIATLTYQGIRRADTAYVAVTAVGTPSTPPPTFATLHVGVPALDSTRMAVPSPKSGAIIDLLYRRYPRPLVAAAQDAGGQRIPGSLVGLRLSAPDQVNFFSFGGTSADTVTSTGAAQVSPTSTSVPGVVWVYAEATVYGVTKTDSLALTLTNPVDAMYFVGPPPGGSAGTVVVAPAADLIIGVGGTVWWVNNATDSADSLDVVFDDPSGAAVDPVIGLLGFPDLSAPGDIAPFEGCAELLDNCLNVRTRRFPQAGTYAWHSARLGISGRVHVQ